MRKALLAALVVALAGACSEDKELGPSVAADILFPPTPDRVTRDQPGPLDAAEAMELPVDGQSVDPGPADAGGDAAAEGVAADLDASMPAELPGPDLVTPKDAKDATKPDDVAGPPDVPVGPDVVEVEPELPPACPTPLCKGQCCAADETCLADWCLPCMAPCGEAAACANDTYCLEQCCVPWGKGPKGLTDWSCQKVLPPGVFRPSLQCEWTGYAADTPYPAHRQVLGTPVVFPMDPSQGSMAIPWIFFVGYGGLDGGFPASSSDGYIRVVDGKECKLLFTLDMQKVAGACPLAIGDLDQDDDFLPEVVACAEGGGLAAFKFSVEQEAWTLLWHSTESNGSLSSFASDQHRWSGPTIVDLDGIEGPEILFGGEVFTAKGVRYGTSLGWKSFTNTGQFALAVDVDQDGSPELVMGDGIWAWAGTDWIKEPYFVQPGTDGYVAVADFGDFPVEGLPATIPEVAVISPGQIRVMRLDGTTVFGPYPLAGGGEGGPPTVGDFDNDGLPEVALASMGAYQVFDFECAAAALPPFCEAPGRRWSVPSQDYSSNKTGSSVFDFEGDGKAEAVYADECFLRVYDGTTGEVLYSRPRSSCTWNENPVVADVDGDYRAEILVGSNENCGISCPAVDPVYKGLRCLDDADCPAIPCAEGFCRCTTSAECAAADAQLVCTAPLPGTPGAGNVCRAAHTGATSGIRVFRDSSDHWVQSRKLWNQHVYYVVNVNDSGTIPPAGGAQLNWLTKGLNNFRQNTQGVANPLAAPDATAKIAGYECAEAGLTVHVKLCNRGSAPLAVDTPVSLYLGAPTVESIPWCTVKSTQDLFPQQCQNLFCSLSPAPAEPATVTAVADDGGDLSGDTTECDETNNLAVLDGLWCP